MIGIILSAKRRKLFNIDQGAGKPLTLAFVRAVNRAIALTTRSMSVMAVFRTASMPARTASVVDEWQAPDRGLSWPI